MTQNDRQEQQQPNFQRVRDLCGEALARGSLGNEGHVLLISATTPQVWVRQRGSGRLVAYSSTESDRLSSVEEFVLDFFA